MRTSSSNASSSATSVRRCGDQRGLAPPSGAAMPPMYREAASRHRKAVPVPGREVLPSRGDFLPAPLRALVDATQAAVRSIPLPAHGAAPGPELSR